jgi:phage tail-like protein
MSVMGTGRQAALNSDVRGKTLTSAIFKIENTSGVAMFSELGGISSEVESAEYMEAGEKGPMFGRFIGRAKPPTVTLKRAMSTGTDTNWVWEWHAMARTGDTKAYRDTTLSLFGAGGDAGTPAKAYMLIGAFPTKVEIAGMKAGATEVVLQTVTLQCDEIIESPK